MRAVNLAVSCGKTTPTPAPAPARQDTSAGHDARNAAINALDSDNIETLRNALADLIDAYDGVVLVTTLLYDGLAAHRDREGDR